MLAFLAGCAEDSDPTAPPTGNSNPTGDISFSNDIAGPIFASNCVSSNCHNSTTQAAGLDLTPSAAFAELVGVQSTQNSSLNRVEAGDPDSSYLYHKIRDGGPGNGTSRMPRGGSLSANDIELIRLWIEQGAKDN